MGAPVGSSQEEETVTMFDEEPEGDQHGECAAEIKRLNVALREATKLTRFIIQNRGCVCNVPGHRCGTNLMLEDVSRIEEHLS